MAKKEISEEEQQYIVDIDGVRTPVLATSIEEAVKIAKSGASEDVTEAKEQE